MVSSGTKCYHLGWNVIIWDEMLSSGMKCYHLGCIVIIWSLFYHLGQNAIIWSQCFNGIIWSLCLVLSCDVIIWDDNTPLFYFSWKLHSLMRFSHFLFYVLFVEFRPTNFGQFKLRQSLDVFLVLTKLSQVPNLVIVRFYSNASSSMQFVRLKLSHKLATKNHCFTLVILVCLINSESWFIFNFWPPRALKYLHPPSVDRKFICRLTNFQFSRTWKVKSKKNTAKYKLLFLRYNWLFHCLYILQI
jgi:hypothetical protein